MSYLLSVTALSEAVLNNMICATVQCWLIRACWTVQENLKKYYNLKILLIVLHLPIRKQTAILAELRGYYCLRVHPHEVTPSDDTSASPPGPTVFRLISLIAQMFATTHINLSAGPPAPAPAGAAGAVADGAADSTAGTAGAAGSAAGSAAVAAGSTEDVGFPAPTAGPSHGIVPVIQNVVATTNLGVSLDLKRIALRARNAEYNPKRFAAVIMRIRDPKTTALIFSSGKIVVTGAKSERESSRASRKYAKIVYKLGYDKAKFTEFTVQNIVASCDVFFPVRLEGLAHAHNSFCSYEPELFPGLIYRMLKPKIVLLIFVSGKVVLTGAKVRREIYDAFDNIYPVLQLFQKPSQ